MRLPCVLFRSEAVANSLFSRGSGNTASLLPKGMSFSSAANIITTPNRELCVFQEFRKIGFCDYQNVFSRNEEKANFKVPPVGRKNSDNNISSAKMKFSRNEENVLWILHIDNNI